MASTTAPVHAVAEETEFSGVVQIVDAHGTRLAEAFGLAHRGLGVPNTVDTRFAIASGGKGFTALAVVALIDEGILSMDTTARSILGTDLALVDDDVTVEHLLAHRSGIGDYLDEEDENLGPVDYVLDFPVHRLDTTDGFLPEVDGYETKFPPGERFSYSNGGYIVLALIAERASGMTYHDLVHERVVERAGMTDTAFLRSDEPGERTALGYLGESGLRTNVLHLPVRGNGDGGIYTTAEDMHRFWAALFDGRIVPGRWVEEMTHPHSVAPVEEARYGLGFWLDEVGPSVRLVGGDAGVSFWSEHDPSTGATWTVLSNSTSGAWPMVRHIRSSMRTRPD